MRTIKDGTLAVFAYLLGRKSLRDPTTPRRTPEHDPDAMPQGDPFHTIGYRHEGPRLQCNVMNTYLPVHVRALSPNVDTSDHVGLKQVARLAFAKELGNRMSSPGECRFAVVQCQGRDVCERPMFISVASRSDSSRAMDELRLRVGEREGDGD
jgi:hypothetical protein